MNRIKRLAGRAAVAVVLMMTASPVLAEWVLNMPEGVTSTSRQVYGLHMQIFYIVVVIGILVFGAMIFSIVRHRKARGVKPAQFHHSTAVEIVWTVIPFAILVVMAVPASTTLIDMYDTSGADMRVKVTGYQWKWQYEYMGEGVGFYSTLAADSNYARRLGSDIDPASVDNYLREVDNRLILPTDTRVELLLTSNDVLHSWWVPELGWKKDTVPGYINKSWTKIEEPGVYRGKCAELCGRGHGFMPVVVEAVEPERFREWLAAKKKGNEAAARAALGRGASSDEAVASR
jgi:cytochrome c oxidase subunit 2